MENLVLLSIAVLTVSGALLYLFRKQKRSSGCVGCPTAGACGAQCVVAEGSNGTECQTGCGCRQR